MHYSPALTRILHHSRVSPPLISTLLNRTVRLIVKMLIDSEENASCVQDIIMPPAALIESKRANNIIAEAEGCKESVVFKPVLLLAPSFSEFVVVVMVVFLTLRQTFSRQCFFVALLDLNVTTLQLQRAGECATGPHPGKVFCCVHGENVAEHFCENWRKPANMKIHRIDTHEHETETVSAVRAARQVRKAEEASFVVVLVFRY